MHMNALLEKASMSVYHVCACYFLRLEDTGAYGAGAVFISSCDVPRGCWEWKSGPPEEQQVFWPAAPPFHPPRAFQQWGIIEERSLQSSTT